MTKICIDGFNIGLPKGTGIATYGRNLLSNLQHLGYDTQILYGISPPISTIELMNEVSITDAASPPKGRAFRRIRRYVANRTTMFGTTAKLVNFSGHVIPPNGTPIQANNLWVADNIYQRANIGYRHTHLLSPLRFNSSSEKPQIMHWTCPLPLFAKGIANIYTFHDLIPLKLPHTTLDDKRAFYRLCKDIINKADHIISVSETTKKDLIQILGADENKITTTYQSVNIPDDVKNRSDNDIKNDLLSVFNLEWKKYFLHFGAVEPKKNLSRIVEAYATSNTNIPLVIVGKTGWLERPELHLIDTIKASKSYLADRIIRYDFLPRNLLYTLIRGARATVFPSLYEGFGLPILESMALGTAVITSKGGATQEIGKHAAIYVDQYDVSSIRQALRFINDPYVGIDEIACKGRQVAADFNNAAYRGRLDAVYKSLT